VASRFDAPALVAGVLVIAFGVVLLLDAGGQINLTFAAFGPIAAAMVGATFVASGLSRRGR
jgi:hypothetical protein